MMTTQSPRVLAGIVGVTHAMSVEGIAKGQRNKEQGYSYRGIDDVLNALSPLLSKHQLVIVPEVIERNVIEGKTKSGTSLWKVTVKVKYRVMSAEDGSAVDTTVYGEAMDSADKATNKAM